MECYVQDGLLTKSLVPEYSEDMLQRALQLQQKFAGRLYYADFANEEQKNCELLYQEYILKNLEYAENNELMLEILV